MSSIEKIPLLSATHAQMQAFAETEGIELTADMMSESGESILREMLDTAGFKTHIYVVSRNVSLAAQRNLQDFRLNSEFDPKQERWIRFMIAPDEGGEEAISTGPVFVGVNHDSAYVPRGEIVVMREILFRHLNVKERRWKQEMGGSLQAIKKRTPRWVDRYPMTVYGVAGFVSEGPPELEEGDLLIAGGNDSRTIAISKAQQAARERLAA